MAALKRVPGLGPKGAQRVILDVGDRLGPVTAGHDAAGTSAEGGVTHRGADVGNPNPDVVAALIQLGWNEATARQAVSAVEPGLTQEADGATTADVHGPVQADVAVVLRAALRWLGGGHRG